MINNIDPVSQTVITGTAPVNKCSEIINEEEIHSIELPMDESCAGQDNSLCQGETMRKAAIQYYPLHAKEEKQKPQAKPWDSFCEAIMMETDFINYFGESPGILTMTEADRIVSTGNLSCDGIDVRPFEKKLQCELGEQASVQNDWDIDRIKGQVPSLSKLSDAFSKVAKDKAIPWEYLKDGCYARAHVACGELLEQDINCSKIYVMIQGMESSFPFLSPKKFLHAENKYMKGEWWYHVAALSFAKDDNTGKTEGYVLDASVNPDRPLKAAEWVKSFWSGDFPIAFDVTHPDIFNPPEQSFTDYEPHRFSRKDFDECLSYSKKACRQYGRALEQIKKEYEAGQPRTREDSCG